MAIYKCSQCGDEHTPENVCAYCTFCVDKLRDAIKAETERAKEFHRLLTAELGMSWQSKSEAAEAAIIAGVEAVASETLKIAVSRAEAAESEVARLKEQSNAHRDAQIRAESERDKLAALNTEWGAKVNESEAQIAALTDNLKRWQQTEQIMTNVRGIVPAPDARNVQAVLIAVDRAEAAEAQVSGLTKKLKEAESALSGRTVSCSRCNEMAK